MVALEQQRANSRRRRSAAPAAPLRHTPAATAAPAVRRIGACACGGACPRCQAKSTLTVGAPDDAFEREANAVADRVMRASDGAGAVTAASPSVQRACTACAAKDEDEERLLQPKSDSSSSAARMDAHAPSSVDAVLRSPGQPLAAGARDFFESRFGHDFSGVRVHADAAAQESARDVHARAFTVGRDLVFAAGQYSPETQEGQRLLAHELTHVVQQTGGEAAPAVQRQQAAPPCPASVSLSSGVRAVHVPACGATPVTASARPASAPVTWSLDNGSTQPGFAGAATTVAAGTTISNAAANPGRITVDPAQTPGFVAVVGDGASGCAASASGSTGAVAQLNFASTPTSVAATSVVGPLTTSATTYGAQFENTLNSASGNSAHLLQVRVNERFSGLATPNASTHDVATPFGTFTLHSNAFTPNSAGAGWDITSSGIMGPDNVGIDRSFIDVGRFVASASNRTPTTTLTAAAPVGFSVQQDLHWFCPQAAVGSQWIFPPFATLTHTRHLFLSGGDVTFVVGIPRPSLAANSDDYTGQPAIINAAASPNPVAVSPSLPPRSPRGTPRPTPNTTTVTADTLPSSLSLLTGTHGLRFSIRGRALGCTIDATTGEVTVGTTPGTIKVRVSDVDRTNHNFDEVDITIVTALPAPVSPPATAPTASHPGLYPQTTPGEIAPPPPLPVSP